MDQIKPKATARNWMPAREDKNNDLEMLITNLCIEHRELDKMLEMIDKRIM